LVQSEDGDQQILVPREADGADHVGHPGTARDQAGMLVDAGIPDPARRRIGGVARKDRLADETLLEGRDSGRVDGGAVAPFQAECLQDSPLP
jgi:hypothetical protein